MESPSQNPEYSLSWSFTPEQEEVLARRSIDMVNQASNAKTVIFLDKSARPLSQLFRRVYPLQNPSKPLPRIIFLNIGTEKIPILENYYNQAIDGNEFPDFLRDIHDLKKVYGEDSVDQLQKLLQSVTREKRLVIDDTYQTGDTSRLTNVILRRADPNNQYSFFPFLFSPEDRAKFPGKHRPSNTAFPWHGVQTGVISQYTADFEKSFTATAPRDPRVAAESRLVRETLDRIALKAINQLHKSAV